jgi:hypothetical protein
MWPFATSARPEYLKESSVITFSYKIDSNSYSNIFNNIFCLWKHHVNILLQSFNSIRKPGSSSVLIICKNNNQIWHIITTDEDPGLRIESFAVINLRGASTNKKYHMFYRQCISTKNLNIFLLKCGFLFLEFASLSKTYDAINSS